MRAPSTRDRGEALARHVVATLSEVPEGSRKLVTVEGRDVVIFNVGGEYFGLFNRCPHQGGSLCDGLLGGLVRSAEPGNYEYTRPNELVRCPWHGWQFDLRTGQSWCEPERIKTKPYAVDVADGRDLVEGPYVAETVKVSVDEQYLVIEA